ncbi:allophanate hydrolase [Acidobacteria bacterium AB60]|nr:allophanate hydrolase [Acidobacteria bacterium AB60]
MDIGTLENAYRNGRLTPSAVVAEVYDEIARIGERPTWITLMPRDQNLARARDLEQSAARALPLFGIPFAIKDNFDVAGLPTTAGCPAFRHIAAQTAVAVQRLIDAGAILIGKTNMDQFATGLVGTRTPYGVCSSVFDSKYISGGSSSGSAVAVAQSLVSFSLGTDTAGSGRVPAAFNQLVGLKPTRGYISTRGVLPACRTLDCVSIFAETCADASGVFAVARGRDSADPYSRVPLAGQNATPWTSTPGFRFGVPLPEQREFFGDEAAGALYEAAIRCLCEIGGTPVSFDYTPFQEAASLLYKGPWVAERLAAINQFLADNPDSVDPTVGAIIRGAAKYNAVEAFEAGYTLRQFERETLEVWKQVDFLLLPTTPTHYTIDQVLADPIELNTKLGYYTNFVNLLDLAAVAVPAGMKPNGLSFGVSLIGPAFSDDGLLRVADRLHRRLAKTIGGTERLLASTASLPSYSTAPPGCLLMAVVGAHLTGQPLNWQLTERKARLVRTTRTGGQYRLYALANTTPPKPGLVFTPGFKGEGIEIEVWAMPEQTIGSFLNMIPPPLCLGTIRLADGSQVRGFLCEPSGIEGAQEITHFGGWRHYVADQISP